MLWSSARKEVTSAAGYLVIFIMPCLLWIGTSLEMPYLAFAVAVILLPLARIVFGYARPGDQIFWHETVATVLQYLPLLYAVALTFAVGAVLWHLANNHAGSVASILGLGLSLWMTMLLATCVAHDLLHRRERWMRLAGHWLAGFTGYPVLAFEHWSHHARPNDTRGAQCPLQSDSVWWFSARRIGRVFSHAYAIGAGFRIRRSPANSGYRQGLRVATAVTLITWACFALAGGWTGVLLYGGMMVGVTFGVQSITYIQHWGLGDDQLGVNQAMNLGWEDDCQVQAWITLGLSFHMAHHEQSQRPYYRLTLTADSPRLPAGYLLLMVLCFFPRAWKKMMLPALQHWQRDPTHPRSSGRHLACFALYRKRPEAAVNR